MAINAYFILLLIFQIIYATVGLQVNKQYIFPIFRAYPVNNCANIRAWLKVFWNPQGFLNTGGFYLITGFSEYLSII